MAFLARQFYDQSASSPSPNVTNLATDLRALRKARGFTLQAIAEQIDRSVGYISQIERGISEPSINDLRKLAAIYGLSLSFFFGESNANKDEQGYVVRAGARRTLGSAEDGLTEELLSPDLGGSYEIIRSVFAPGAELPEPVFRETEEAGYIVSGQLTLSIGNKTFILNAGDSFRFSNESYCWANKGTVQAVVIWVISPPVY